MIIDGNSKIQQNKVVNQDKKEKDPFKTKDSFTFASMKNEAEEVLDRYKHLKEEQTKGREEPWWVEAADAFLVQGDIVKELGGAGKVLMASSLVSGIGAITVGKIGLKTVKEGIKEKDKEKILEGSAALLAASSTGTDFVSSMIKSHGILGSAGAKIAQIAEIASKGFGLAFGIADVIIGVRELVNGVKNKNKDGIIDGSLEAGIGATYILTTVVGGGPIGAVAIGALYGAKLAYDYRKDIGEFGKKILHKLHITKPDENQ